MTGYEYFDHTADVGMRVIAPTPALLFQAAAEGLTYLLVPAPETVAETQWRHVALENDDPAYLLFDWLAELLYLFESEGFVGKSFEVDMPTPQVLNARISGDIFDRERHPSGNEVKAVTYHGLTVEKDGDSWRAEVIFDI